jgi:purine-binding chemotaxis protein CheW
MTGDSPQTYILFQIAGSTYGIRSEAVHQVEMIEHVTPLPGGAPYIDGVILTRGQVIPAINMRLRFGLERVAYDVRSRLVVVNSAGRKVGLVVDSAREFVRIPENSIRPPHEVITDVNHKYMEGIATLGERIVLILNVEEVVALQAATAPAVTAGN